MSNVVKGVVRGMSRIGLPERIPDFAGIQAGMQESRKMWQPDHKCESDEQVVNGGTSPSRAEYGEHCDKMGPLRAVTGHCQILRGDAKRLCTAFE